MLTEGQVESMSLDGLVALASAYGINVNPRTDWPLDNGWSSQIHELESEVIRVAIRVGDIDA